MKFIPLRIYKFMENFGKHCPNCVHDHEHNATMINCSKCKMVWVCVGHLET